MSDMKGMLVNSADRMFASLCPPEIVNAAEQGQWPTRLWGALEGAGMSRAWLSERAGGSGVGVGDVLAILRAAGRFAAPVPLAETLLAGWLLESAGLRIPDGPLTVAPVTVEDRIGFGKTASGWRLSGVARHVPWASDAGHIVVIGQSRGQTLVALAESSQCLIAPGKNLAGEPRDTVDFNAVTVPARDLARAPAGISQAALWQRGALTRIALMTGAVEKVMQLSLRYANDRVQFGKPIGKFQAVQQQLALMCGEVAAACVATEASGQAADCGLGLGETACAKVRAGEAAGTVAALAHQIHAAIGITYEHPLHHSTRRLWSWREEFGSEAQWAGYLGHWIANLGPEGLWPAMTCPTGIPVDT
jgi:alkylation response protein AidB-like acyl-CoA dehydrogenase